MLTTLHGLRGQDPQVASYFHRYPLRFGILMENQGRSLTSDIKSNISPTSVHSQMFIHFLWTTTRFTLVLRRPVPPAEWGASVPPLVTHSFLGYPTLPHSCLQQRQENIEGHKNNLPEARIIIRYKNRK